MCVVYSESLAAWVFPRQVAHRSYAEHKVDGCARARFVYTSKKIVGVGKHKLKATKEHEQHIQAAKRPAQSGLHTAQHPLQQPGIPQPAYMSANSVECGLLTALGLARYNYNYVPWYPKRTNDA